MIGSSRAAGRAQRVIHFARRAYINVADAVNGTTEKRVGPGGRIAGTFVSIKEVRNATQNR